MDLGVPELLIILVVVLLLFGPAKLPSLARSLGEATRALRDGASARDEAGVGPTAPAATPASNDVAPGPPGGPAELAETVPAPEVLAEVPEAALGHQGGPPPIPLDDGIPARHSRFRRQRHATVAPLMLWCVRCGGRAVPSDRWRSVDQGAFRVGALYGSRWPFEDQGHTSHAEVPRGLVG